jgi:F-type H+-transporting ATPase subunit b
MKRAGILVILATVALWLPAAHAQEPDKANEPATEMAGEPAAEGEHGHLELWKWANFIILAGALGYMIQKNAGPFFLARSQHIRKEMMEAEEARRQSEARSAEVDRRLASLDAEIVALRADSQKEANEEAKRLAEHTAAEIAKIQAHSEREIASAGKAARMELKRYSAHLAVGLAEQRIRSRINPETDDALVRAFVRELEPSSSSAAI